jgi:predicted signal transduction protein with EAL and GGDEF domain
VQERDALGGLHVLGAGHSPSASIGLAVFPEDGTDTETLVRGADRALLRQALRTLDAENGASADLVPVLSEDSVSP